MKEGSLHTRSFRRMHFSVFRYRWCKNGFTGPKNFRGFRETDPWFDERFSMETHITKTCGAAFYHLHNIRRIRKYLSQNIAETLIHAFVTSRIDYCKSLLFGLHSVQISKIQRMQNAAARVIFMKSKYCHITELHWLPVTYRIQFKVILITFKALHDMASSYISSLLRVRQNTKYSLRSNNAILLITPPLKNYVSETSGPDRFPSN